ncbi:MAG: hypothetical protein ACM3SP_20430 [Chloroflexota bacterium]
MEEEYKAGRFIADALETTEGNLMFMRDAGLLQPYNSPVLKNYPDDATEDAAKGLYYWAMAPRTRAGDRQIRKRNQSLGKALDANRTQITGPKAPVSNRIPIVQADCASFSSGAAVGVADPMATRLRYGGRKLVIYLPRSELDDKVC